MRGDLHRAGFLAVLSYIMSPWPQRPDGKGSLGSTACPFPSQISHVASLHWGSKGRVGGYELGNVSPSGAFLFVSFVGFF